MNRNERRAAAKRAASALSAADLLARAKQYFEQGAFSQAEDMCGQIVTREPAHVGALNLSALAAQAAGRHNVAIKRLRAAIAVDPRDAAFPYNLASSYQALGRRDEAADSFRRAIALGLSGKRVEDVIAQNPTIGACLARLEQRWPLSIPNGELFGTSGLTAIAADVFFRSVLETVLIRRPIVEAFLIQLRSALLALATAEPGKSDDDLMALFCAVAQQCFITEYVYPQSEQETRQAERLRDALLQGDHSPLTLAAVAAYGPLHTLPDAASLADKPWPAPAARLIRQQISEPLEELRDRAAIPALTPIDDETSRAVQNQYEENPYPRWTTLSLQPAATGAPPEEILIAGCGTGKHSISIALLEPNARILAVDISRASLAYARRKTREAGISTIDYAQADILRLGALQRRFDVVESAGVLHHLADPFAGWRTLLSLLKPQGRMCIGLYSEIARRDILQARDFVAERGLLPTLDGIRKFRQEILRGDARGRWDNLTSFSDFYSVSGCRDLAFHVMEHNFTLPQIKAFLNAENLEFLGFELAPDVLQAFARKFPSAAPTDLDAWHIFETENPTTFREMYLMWMQRRVG